MRLARVVIDNILGIEHLELAPGTITVIEGANGVGKTSVLEAIKAGLGGGRDATLLRQGAAEGQVVLVLDDGTEISKRVRADGPTAVTVKHPTFGKIAKPQGFLDKLADALSVNPVSFITATSAERAKVLLDVLPVPATDEDLRAAGVTELPPESRNGLQRIDAARRQVYDERTGVNRAAKEKRATIAQLEASVPPTTGSNPSAEAEAAETEASRLRAVRDADVQKIRDDEAAREKAVNVETETAIRHLEMERTEKLAEIRRQANEYREAVRADLEPKIFEATKAASTARERVARWGADEKARAYIKENQGAAAQLEATSETLSATLAALDALKDKALAALPIKGVEVKDGDVLVDGIPFDRVNKARQVRVALNVARLRAGQLGLVCVDGLESLDAETFAAFETAAVKSGLQFVVNRVTAGPLAIRTHGEAA